MCFLLLGMFVAPLIDPIVKALTIKPRREFGEAHKGGEWETDGRIVGRGLAYVDDGLFKNTYLQTLAHLDPSCH